MTESEEIKQSDEETVQVAAIEVNCTCDRGDPTLSLYEQSPKTIEKARPFSGLLRPGGMNKIVYCIRQGFFLNHAPPHAKSPLVSQLSKFRTWISPECWPFDPSSDSLSSSIGTPMQIDQLKDPNEIWRQLDFPPQLSDLHKDEILDWLRVITCPSCSIHAISRFKKFLIDASPPYPRLIRLLLEEGANTKLVDLEREGMEFPGWRKIWTSLLKFRNDQSVNSPLLNSHTSEDPPDDSEFNLQDLFESGLLARQHLCHLEKFYRDKTMPFPAVQDSNRLVKLQQELSEARATLNQWESQLDTLRMENQDLCHQIQILKGVSGDIVEAVIETSESKPIDKSKKRVRRE